MELSINHITTPKLKWRDFLRLSSDLGAKGVEFRNDLSVPLFSDESPELVRTTVKESGLKIFCLSQIYPFNVFSDKLEHEIRKLIKIAKMCGAEAISLIPSNDGNIQSYSQRQTDLRTALRKIKPLLENGDLLAMVEPLGFESSSLRTKEEAVNAIEAVNAASTFKIIHDTFHHHLAGETEFFSENTGIVHVSGLVDKSLSVSQMEDKHRILVNEKDLLGNVHQINELLGLGYSGPISLETFSPEVHAAKDIRSLIENSINFIKQNI